MLLRNRKIKGLMRLNLNNKMSHQELEYKESRLDPQCIQAIILEDMSSLSWDKLMPKHIIIMKKAQPVSKLLRHNKFRNLISEIEFIYIIIYII